jgi:hypothetical protein
MGYPLPFHKEIYTTTTYSTWLKHTNEKDRLPARFPETMTHDVGIFVAQRT